MIRTEAIDDLAELELHADAWNRLCLETRHCNPQQSHAWVAAHLEHRLRSGVAWCCFLAWNGDQLIGVLPLVAGQTPRTLQTPQDPHTHTSDAVLAPGREEAALTSLLTAAARRYPKHIRVEFPRIPADSSTPTSFASNLSRWKATVRAAGSGYYLPIQGSFDQYRASLSGNFRSNLNKAAKKLGKLPNVTTEFLSGAAASPELLPRFMEVEARSWKGAEGTAILSSPELVAFYQTLTRRLAAAGWLEWHLLNVGERTIAANLAVRFNSTVVVWKLGYDAEYAKCSPGNMLFEHLVKHAYDSGNISEINLLTDYAWYKQWRMQPRSYLRVRIYPPRFLSRLAWATEVTTVWASQQELLKRARSSRQPGTSQSVRS